MGQEIIHVRCSSLLEWVMLPDGTIRRPIDDDDWFFWCRLGRDICGYYMVGRTTVGDMEVMTDFISIDHDRAAIGRMIRDEAPPPGYQPKVFETMIFGGVMDQFTKRYRTLRQARFGHKAAVLRARAAWADVNDPAHDVDFDPTVPMM
jgi:hypothetical protein